MRLLPENELKVNSSVNSHLRSKESVLSTAAHW